MAVVYNASVNTLPTTQTLRMKLSSTLLISASWARSSTLFPFLLMHQSGVTRPGTLVLDVWVATTLQHYQYPLKVVIICGLMQGSIAIECHSINIGTRLHWQRVSTTTWQVASHIQENCGNVRVACLMEWPPARKIHSVNIYSGNSVRINCLRRL